MNRTVKFTPVSEDWELEEANGKVCQGVSLVGDGGGFISMKNLKIHKVYTDRMHTVLLKMKNGIEIEASEMIVMYQV